VNFDLNQNGDASTILRARIRAIAVLVTMILGITLARYFDAWGSLFWMSLGCGFIGVSIPARGQIKSVLILVSVLLIAAGWSEIRLNEPKADRLDRIIELDLKSSDRTDSIPIQILGVISEPVQTRFTPRTAADPVTWTTTRTETRIQIHKVTVSDSTGKELWIDASGVARLIVPNEVTTQGSDSVVKAGDRVRVVGLFQPPTSARNLSDLDWEMINTQSGRVGTIIVQYPSMILSVKHESIVEYVSGWVLKVRSNLKTRSLNALGFNQTIEDQDYSQRRAMLGALLLGERDPAFGDIYESFQRVGVAHVLAISGFHLALVILLGVLLIRAIGEYPRAETVCVVFILAMGLFVIPMRPPIVRAGVIVCLLLLASRIGRRYDRLTILAWVGAGLLIWRPGDAFSLGYQLSMGITALLVILSNQQSPTSMSILVNQLSAAHQRVIKRVQNWILQTAKINFACWIVASPAIMFHAGFVSLLAPVVALILIPMVILLMVVGYLQIGIGVLFPSITESTIGILDWFAFVIQTFIETMDSIPGSSVRVGNIGIVWTLIATGILALLVTGRWKIREVRSILIMLVCVSWIFIGPAILHDQSTLRVNMIDVGDGTAIIVESDGQTLLWDCGSLNRRVGKGIAQDMQLLGVRRINDVVVTHDNLDHFNGLADLASRVEIDRVWISERLMSDPSIGWSYIQDKLERLEVDVQVMRRSTRFKFGYGWAECLWPSDEKVMTMRSNNTSIVMRIQVPIKLQNGFDVERTVLLTGDIEQEAMTMILDEHPRLQCDVLELPHHGSAKAKAYSFVESLNPSVVLQSTGISRVSDPRWDEMRKGRSWYTTALNGGAWVRIIKNGDIEHGWAR